ncbi:hypothetical protein V3C99_012461 [Haemonchus contortus]|uniref:DUF1758 domain-containing protein n=1 Tax=Haemonchus contortus TaxID=6289 RepID=A0A7I4Y3X3_HAECO
MDFLFRDGIVLSAAHNSTPRDPDILLGCDQLWTFLLTPCPQHTLPSGLHLIPPKLGYLLSGKQRGNREQCKTGELTPEEITPSPVTINTLINFDGDLERWDRYWTMDLAGVCEFTGTKDAEKEAIDAKVSEFFEQTIQRRSNGYYVRLPYKEGHDPLPLNKAIAIRRLHSELNKLRQQPEILRPYDNTIQDQKEQGIIGEIPNDKTLEGDVLHYIPHQPVITPHKETTKLCVVFDASAHFSNQPSLNDVLHQGPLILPDLHAMLLRFRTAPLTTYRFTRSRLGLTHNHFF